MNNNDNNDILDECYYNENNLLDIDIDIDKSFFLEKEEEVNYRDIEVDIITLFSSKLDSIPSEEQSIDFQQIVQYVKDFLKKKCKHTIIFDSIDIHPERSQTIMYCTKCGSTISGYSEKTNDIFWKNN